MRYLKKTVLPIILTGIWINISEIVRWGLVIKSHWVNHYQSMNLVFPTEPVNGIIWLIWGFLFAIIVFILSKKFNLLQTTLLSWFVVFVMLWVVLWNINILPRVILWIVVPLSLLEAFISALICKRLSPK
jgi:hypothetical protein